MEQPHDAVASGIVVHPAALVRAASALTSLSGMIHHHVRFTLKITIHLVAEAALHLMLPAVAAYTLPLTVLYVLWEVWQHVRATKLLASKAPPALPPAPAPPARSGKRRRGRRR